jgi:hypothetical protein
MGEFSKETVARNCRNFLLINLTNVSLVYPEFLRYLKVIVGNGR